MVQWSKVKEIESLRAGGLVRRYHTCPVVRDQNNAEHSGQAAILLIMLHPSPSRDLVHAVLTHDCGEQFVGDMPSPIKRARPDLKQLYDEAENDANRLAHPVSHAAAASLSISDHAWLRAVDILECAMHALDELRLGNTRMRLVHQRACDWLVTDSTVPQEVVEFTKEIRL